MLNWSDQRPTAGAKPGSVRIFRIDSGNVPLIGRTTADGATHFGHVVPGQYRVIPGLSGPAAFYAAAVRVNGRDVLGTGRRTNRRFDGQR